MKICLWLYWIKLNNRQNAYKSELLYICRFPCVFNDFNIWHDRSWNICIQTVYVPVYDIDYHPQLLILALIYSTGSSTFCILHNVFSMFSAMRFFLYLCITRTNTFTKFWLYLDYVLKIRNQNLRETHMVDLFLQR